nr:hypothetical protein [Tanacetum cinerariifolium]
MVDYDDDYQEDAVQNNSDDPLTSAMILLACAITRNFSNPTNNCLRTSSNTRNQAIVQDDREQQYPKQPKIINNTIGDDQIDSNIILDEPNDDVNSSSVKDDNNGQQSYELEKLARNVYKEAEKQ